MERKQLTIRLPNCATICLIDARMARVIGEGSSRARRKQASGDFATICLPSRLSRVRAPSPVHHVNRLSARPAESRGDNQAVKGKQGDGFLCAQRCTATFCLIPYALPHKEFLRCPFFKPLSSSATHVLSLPPKPLLHQFPLSPRQEKQIEYSLRRGKIFMRQPEDVLSSRHRSPLHGSRKGVTMEETLVYQTRRALLQP